ncbi:D-lactate dehydrogenase (cytochrome) [Colletotrichum scovillei]|nr:D-lactate dehydrogenase (cytochrome) [Colletotrichum scovillei]KAG7067369.1 D-lactate dehydrogenase (cytochrome) [Colletotrichum scovillei]
MMATSAADLASMPLQHTVCVATARLRLRPVEAGDLRAIHQMRLDSEVMRYMPGVETVVVAEESRRSIERVRLMMKEGGFSFAVMQRNHPTDEQTGRGDFQALQTRSYASPASTKKGIAQIRQELGDASMSTDEDDIEEHGYSEWSTSNSSVRPKAVVRPTSTQDVASIVKICSRYRIPMVPYGAGSSVEGNFSSTHPGVCIDLSLMDKIVEFHPDDLDVTVQAGVNWTQLNESNELKASGLFLPLDPSPTAQIGGMIATNCSGTNAMRYGTMKDYVLSLTVVLADGSIIKTRRRPRKTSAGYNLNSLFTGSEGTLGIITEATLKLAVVPSDYSVATATFLTVKDAADAASKMIRKGINLAACELMDDEQMKVINKSGGVGGKMWEELPTLFLKFSGSRQNIEDSVRLAKSVSSSSKCQTFLSAKKKEDMDSLWSARKQALWACLAARPEGTEIWSTDVAVPISRMAQMIEESKNDAIQMGLFSSVLGHVGDGNFHQMIMYDPKRPSDVANVKGFINGMMHKALEMEGTVSGEHGIGIGKKHCLLEELGSDTIGVMKAIKGRLDPHWLMNPGKIFDE